MQTLLTFPYLNVYLHEGSCPVLELEWLGYAPGADMRAAVGQAVALSHQHRAKGWVTDDRRQGAIRPRDLDWAAQTVLLSLNDTGLQRLAQLEPTDALHRLTVAAMYTQVQPQLRFELRRFNDLAPARAWAAGGR